MGQVPEVDPGDTRLIDQALGDYSQQHVMDETGMGELLSILGSTKQVYDAAKISGFTDAQAFQFARDYLLEVFHQAAIQAGAQ